jgi:hypothetical protein
MTYTEKENDAREIRSDKISVVSDVLKKVVTSFKNSIDD